MEALQLICLTILPALVITGGLTDLTTMKIPNWISAALVVAFLPAALVMGLPLREIALHLAIGLAALFAGAGMFALRWIGGGDAKLMAAACLWLGLSGSAAFLVWTGLAGGLFCLALILSRNFAAPMVVAAPGWVRQLMEPKGDIPYGVAIAAGALLAWPESPLVMRFLQA